MRVVALLVFAFGCGIDEAGQATITSDGSAPESASDVQQEAAPPQSCSIDAGACVASLPSGWELVAYDLTGEALCPSNYTSAPVVANVVDQPGVCDCGCTVTKPPACDVGTLQRYVSNDTSCSMTGISLSVNGPGCTTYTANPLSSHAKSSPLPPTGGTCTGDAIPNKGLFSQNFGITCKVPPACEEQFCGGDVPGGFQPCIEKSGQQQCPSGWSAPVLAADDFTFDCSACTCDVNGPSTCTSTSLDIFGDTQCTKKLATMPVDGNCDVDTGAGQTPFAFMYHSTLTQACNAAGPKTMSNLQLVNARTICCK